MSNMISAFTNSKKKLYSFFYACDEDFNPLYYGFTLQGNTSRPIQHDEDFLIDKSRTWMENTEGFWRVSCEGTLDPVYMTKKELHTFLRNEFGKHGGLTKDGGRLHNKFIPVSSITKSELFEYTAKEESSFPDDLLRNVALSFGLDTNISYDSFLKEVKRIQGDIAGFRKIKENVVILKSPKVIIQYEKYNYERSDFDEPRITLEAENNESFSVGELLFKLHKRLSPILGTEDNRFFEGLTFATEKEQDNAGVPIYFMDTGT